nr:class II aldolase/adducin family protein [Chthonobacter albigriseus]
MTIRRAIVDACREMNRSGLNQGTAGNISVRRGEAMLITPSATPYEAMQPDDIAVMPFEAYGVWTGPLAPSTEWRMHLDVMLARPDVKAIVHAHPVHATALAMCRKPIPAAHYMVAAFGGTDVRCSRYATYGTKELSMAALEAMEGRTAVLLANHGILAVGASLAEAMWRAVELETLARQYILSLGIPGGPVILDDGRIAETLAKFGDYGLRHKVET